MALIQWDDSFSVNISEIDRQHQKLIDMINNLNDAMAQGKGKEVVGPIISSLAGYTVTHFQTEEQYFIQYGYPDADRHKEEHEAFKRKIAEFKNKFNTSKIGLSVEIMDFLSNWLQIHIKTIDKKYAPFLIEKGLK